MSEIRESNPEEPHGLNFAELLSEITRAHAPSNEEWDKIKIELSRLKVGDSYDWIDNTGIAVPIKKVDEESYIPLWPEGYWDN